MKPLRHSVLLLLFLAAGLEAQTMQYMLEILPSGNPSSPAVVVAAGQSITFTAQAYQISANGTRQPIQLTVQPVWAVGANMPGTITPNGVYTAPPPNSIPLPGRSLVTATAAFNGVTIHASVAIVITNGSHTTLDYTIMGVVRNANQAPIAHASVSVQNAGNLPFMVTVITDAQGAYAAHVPAGTYVVRADAQGFVGEFYDNASTLTAATRLTTDPNNKTIDHIDFVLDPVAPPVLYTLSGTVTDGTNPVAGAAVTAVPSANSTPRMHVVTARTDANGNYTMQVPAGSYIVRAEAVGFLATFHPSTAIAAQATVVVLDAQNPTRSNINITMLTGGVITGVVTNAATNAPIDKAQVVLQAATATPNAIRIVAVTDAQGVYRIGGLPGGSFIASASAHGFHPQHFDHVADPTLATPVVVTAGQTTSNINFALASLPAVSGTVVDAATQAPIPNAEVVFDGGGRHMMTRTDAQGTYSIALPAGTYKARAVSQGYAQQWYDGKSDPALADDVIVPATGAVTGIDFDLTRFGGSIAGTVYDNNNAPIADATVRVWMVPSTTNPSTTRPFFAHVKTQANGTYVVLGVPAGSFIVAANAPGKLEEFYSNASTLQAATPVAVALNQNVTGIDFSLAAGGTITGTVIDAATNSPIAHAFVMLHGPTAAVRNAGVRTNAQGQYAITGLPTGNYKVFAVAPGYTGEFYDNTTQAANATLVAVTAPNTTSGINFALAHSPVRVHHFTGTVTSAATAQPLTLALVEAVDPITGEIVSTTTDMNGAFDFTGPEGAVLRVRAIGYAGEYSGATRNWKEAGSHGLTAGENFALTPLAQSGMATLEGMVRDDATLAPVADAWIFGTAPNGDSFFGITDSDGRYWIDGTSGEDLNLFVSGVMYDPVETDATFETPGATRNFSVHRSSVLAVDAPILPGAFELEQNWPNPFNPSTTIAFSIGEQRSVRLAIYDILGREVQVLVDGLMPAGRSLVTFNASALPSGTYLCRLTSGGAEAVRTMVLAK